MYVSLAELNGRQRATLCIQQQLSMQDDSLDNQPLLKRDTLTLACINLGRASFENKVCSVVEY